MISDRSTRTSSQRRCSTTRLSGRLDRSRTTLLESRAAVRGAPGIGDEARGRRAEARDGRSESGTMAARIRSLETSQAALLQRLERYERERAELRRRLQRILRQIGCL